MGFPSGPTSSLACATTHGAVCACDGAAANWMAVRAVVASSRNRSFVMMVSVSWKFLAAGLSTSSGDQRISVRPDCGGFQTRTCLYFRRREVRKRGCSLRIQAAVQIVVCIVPSVPLRLFEAGTKARLLSSRRRYFRYRSQVRGCLVPAVHAPAILPARGPATPPAVETHPALAWAEALRAEGFRAGFPAAAPTACRA